MTGLVNQELLLQNEYLAAENRIWKARLQPGWRLSDGERATLAEIGKRLGRKGLEQVARLARPDTVLLRKCESKQSACFMIFTECPIHRGSATLGHAEKGVKNEFRNGTEFSIL